MKVLAMIVVAVAVAAMMVDESEAGLLGLILLKKAFIIGHSLASNNNNNNYRSSYGRGYNNGYSNNRYGTTRYNTHNHHDHHSHGYNSHRNSGYNSGYNNYNNNRYHGRHGRSVEEEVAPAPFAVAQSDVEQELQTAFLQASVSDWDDCAKAFVCQLNAKPEAELNEEETTIRGLFTNVDSINVNSASVEFDLAALIGQKAGAERCLEVYSRCQADYNKLSLDMGDFNDDEVQQL